jgi:hypothetical protein
MSNLIPDGSRFSATGAPPVLSEAPGDAFLYEQVCLRPLPPNATLDYRVRIDDSTMDFYFHYDALPGASVSSRKWVCRTGITANDPNQQTIEPGQQLYDVQQIDPNQYDAKASDICSQDSPGFFSRLACGTASFGDLPQAAQWLIWGLVGLIALISVVWIFSASRTIGLV